MSITVKMSAPYLSLGHVVSAIGAAVAQAKRNGEELQNPEEVATAASVEWEGRLRMLAHRRTIKGHDWDTLAVEDWANLDIEHDVFYVDDLNDCEELTRAGFWFAVVESEQWQKDSLASLEEFLVNGEDGINWAYWVWKMKTLSTAEAARLSVGLDPDVFRDLNEEPKANFDSRSLRKRAFNIERLALREGQSNHTAFDWLLWVKEQGFEVHHGFSKAANEKKSFEDATKTLSELPPKEAAYWERAEAVADGRRQVTVAFAGCLSTQHFTLPQFIEAVADRLERWQEGEYAIIEAAQVLADANSSVIADSLCEQMETAIHSEKLVLRRNGLPIPVADLPRGRLWNRFVRADDINVWLSHPDTRASYRLTYPYAVDAERILSHPADPILSQGGTQSEGRASVDKCRCLAV